MKNYNITTPETLNAWTNANDTNNGGNIALYVENTREIYARFEWLCKACLKQFKKYGGLDLSYLVESSTLKDITRDARKYGAKYGERYTMNEDRAARRALALSVFEYCAAELA